MLTVNKYFKKLPAFFALCSISISNCFAASGADEVFAPINEKSEELVQQLVFWAATLSLLCIIGFGMAVMVGKFSKFWGLCIIGGCILILTASAISSWLLG